MVTHVHGAVDVGDESDGYPEAWFLPAREQHPGRLRRPTAPGTTSSRRKAAAQVHGARLGAGLSPSTSIPTASAPHHLVPRSLARHDTPECVCRPGRVLHHPRRPCGDKAVIDSRTARPPSCPDPRRRRAINSRPTTYCEIPLADPGPVVQRRWLAVLPGHARLLRRIAGPIHPRRATFSPIWNPEFFGNTIIVNGNTWPFLQVEQRRYRFRMLNGCQSRFLILDFASIPGVEVWQIGNEGGFLPAPVNLTADNNNQLLIGPGRACRPHRRLHQRPARRLRAGQRRPGRAVRRRRTGTTEFEPADPATTGQVMQFRVVPAAAPDPTTPPQFLQLPAIAPLPGELRTRGVGAASR